MAISEEVAAPQVSVKLEFPSVSDQVIIHVKEHLVLYMKVILTYFPVGKKMMTVFIKEHRGQDRMDVLVN